MTINKSYVCVTCETIKFQDPGTSYCVECKSLYEVWVPEGLAEIEYDHTIDALESEICDLESEVENLQEELERAEIKIEKLEKKS